MKLRLSRLQGNLPPDTADTGIVWYVKIFVYFKEQKNDKKNFEISLNASVTEMAEKTDTIPGNTEAD